MSTAEQFGPLDGVEVKGPRTMGLIESIVRFATMVGWARHGLGDFFLRSPSPRDLFPILHLQSLSSAIVPIVERADACLTARASFSLYLCIPYILTSIYPDDLHGILGSTLIS